jgi:hypothetical protein
MAAMKVKEMPRERRGREHLTPYIRILWLKSSQMGVATI